MMNKSKTYQLICNLLVIAMSVCSMAGCGSKTGNETDSLKKKWGADIVSEKETDKKEEVQTPDLFEMDHKPLQGFMSMGEQQTEVPKGYVGIYSIEDMQNIGEKKNGKYMLMSDLDFSQISWNALDFEGILEGNYHKIFGLQSCLIRTLKGTVRNLALEHVNAEGAALAGHMWSGELENCYVTGVIRNGAGLVKEITGSYNGVSTSVSIVDCYNAANIESESREAAAGIVGSIDLSQSSNKAKVNIVIRNCENYGTISAQATAGGIVSSLSRGSSSGYHFEAQIDCSITKCFNYGNVSGSGAAGGIAGYLGGTNASKNINNNFNIEQCANYSEITGQNEETGAICGTVDLRANEGFNHVITVNIEDCLNTASVTIHDPEHEARDGGGVCGEIRLWYGTCKINRCLNIGNTKSEYYSKPSINTATPVYECNDYYTTNHMSIGKMKDISVNLINFDYPGVWGISDLYNGFPHPYGSGESEQVQAYFNKKADKKAEELTETMNQSEITLMQRYSDMLASISMGGRWPEDTDISNQQRFLTEYAGNLNYYAIADVNQDGTKELVIKVPSIGIIIYSYDLKKNKVNREEANNDAEEWEKNYQGSDSLQWIALKAENYNVYTQAYIAYCLDTIKKDLNADVDVGVMYMEDIEWMDVLKEKYNITFEEVDDGFSYDGTYNGQTVFTKYCEDGGSLNYSNNQVEGLTLLGLYPGISEKEAVKRLEKYGFMKHDFAYSDSVSYITGGSNGNYIVTYETENGILTSISIRAGSLYTG